MTKNWWQVFEHKLIADGDQIDAQAVDLFRKVPGVHMANVSEVIQALANGGEVSFSVSVLATIGLHYVTNQLREMVPQ